MVAVGCVPLHPAPQCRVPTRDSRSQSQGVVDAAGAAMNQVAEILKQVERERLYGKIILEFHDGRLFLIRKEQSIKPNQPTEGNTHVNNSK
jgi:hypothetical protein